MSRTLLSLAVVLALSSASVRGEEDVESQLRKVIVTPQSLPRKCELAWTHKPLVIATVSAEDAREVQLWASFQLGLTPKAELLLGGASDVLASRSSEMAVTISSLYWRDQLTAEKIEKLLRARFDSTGVHVVHRFGPVTVLLANLGRVEGSCFAAVDKEASRLHAAAFR